MEIPEELTKAKQLLEKAEKDNNPETAISKFSQGIDICETYLEDNPDSQYVGKIRNIIMSHTRAMVAKAIQYTEEGQFEDNFELWLNYLLKFDISYDAFGKIYKEELKRLIKKLEEKLQKDNDR